MGEPRAITYKEVRKASESDGEAADKWREIGEITGAGHLRPTEEAAIDITDFADAAKLDKFLAKKSKKEGNQ